MANRSRSGIGSEMMKFTEEHEWLLPEGDLIVVGITAHAAEQLFQTLKSSSKNNKGPYGIFFILSRMKNQD